MIGGDGMLSFKLLPVLVASAVLSVATIASAAVSAVIPAAQVLGMQDLGPLGAATPVRIAVLVRYQHEAELEQLVGAQADPSSPMYHHFVSEAQFRSYFSPTVSEYALAVSALRRAGFTIAGEYPNRTLVDAIAPAFTVERTFATQLHRFEQPGGGVGYANVSPATIPATMPYVKGIAGLDNRSASAPAVAHTAGAQPALSGDAQLIGPDGGFSPHVSRRAYDFPGPHGFDGTGVRVGEIAQGYLYASDLATFLAEFGITRKGPPPTVVPVDGPCNITEACSLYDSETDVEWLSALAPGADIYLYQVNNTTDFAVGALDGYNRVVSDNFVDVVNITNEYSICEALEVNLVLLQNEIFEQGSATGMTFVSNAQSCQAPYTNLPTEPADSPGVLGVTESTLFTDAHGNRVAETALLSEGGGVSALEPAPPEQLAIKGVNRSGRNAPDIATALFANGTGRSEYARTPAGSAPRWIGGAFIPETNNAAVADMVAEWVQMSGGRLGAVDLTLYDIFAANGYSDAKGPLFDDITSGCIGTYDGKAICARPGYDVATGIGAPDGFDLGMALR
jgi:kumamolisin